MEAQSQEEFVKHCQSMHVMCMSGREEGVTSIHFGFVRARNVPTRKRYNVKESHTKLEVGL